MRDRCGTGVLWTASGGAPKALALAAIPGGSGNSTPHAFARDGYDMVSWRGDGFRFTAVSDLEPGELAAFGEDYRRAAGAADMR